ncbi:MAG: hypothetical protein II634_00155 [Lachnospiraceae bacterium]|nr:hypothetical protein [Lachnospiraceae bacterium]
MKERLEAIRNACFEKLSKVQAMDALQEIRVEFLGKKGALTEVLKSTFSGFSCPTISNSS